MRFPYHIALLALAVPLHAWESPEEGRALMQSYNSASYGAGGPVLALASSDNGDVFVGTNRVLLMQGWRSTAVVSAPGVYGFRALAADDAADRDDRHPAAEARRVWAGGVGDLGFLQRDAKGVHSYTSLKDAFTASTGKPPGEILAVAPAGSGALFVGEQAVFKWDGTRFTTWPLPCRPRLQPLHPGDGRLWVYRPGFGILTLGPTGPRTLIGQADLPGEVVWLLAGVAGDPSRPSRLDDGWLLGTVDGAFIRDGGAWTPLTSLSDTLKEALPSCAVAIHEADIAIGTQNQGVIIATREGRVLSRIDDDYGLGDNQVNALCTDATGDLWIGTASGWTRVAPPGLVSTYSQRSGKPLGYVRGIVRAGETLYVAASRGAYAIAPREDGGGPAQLTTLPVPPAPIVTAGIVADSLYVGGVGGLWQWASGAWRPLYKAQGTVECSAPANARSKAIWFAFDRSLNVLEADRRGGWNVRKLVSDLGDNPCSILDDGAGHVWVATVAKGVIEYQVDPAERRVRPSEAHFVPGKELPPEFERPTLVQVGGKVVLFAKAGILTRNAQGTGFEPMPSLQGYSGIVPGETLANGRTLWLVQRHYGSELQDAALVEIGVNREGAWEMTPMAAGSLTRAGQPTFLHCEGDPRGIVAWVGGFDGVIRIGPDALRPAPPSARVRLTSVTAILAQPAQSRPSDRSARRQNAPAETIRLPLAGQDASLPSNTQRIRFDYSIPASLARQWTYQTQLAGFEEDWSQPNGGQSREFVGLAPGHYEFRVREMDRFGRAGPALSYAFSRAAPWYTRWPAISGYCTLLILGIYGGVRWRVRSLRKQNERLNLMVDERTRELAMANAQKMEFLASISHEIRNPLNGIVGLVGMLKKSTLGAREREMALSLDACSRSLRRIFDQVLGFARLEEGRVAVRERPFRLQTVLDDVVALFSAEAAQRNCPLASRIEGPGAGMELYGDDEKIRTIVENFVANALKYAPGKPIEISASLEGEGPTEGRAPYLRSGLRQTLSISVTDHGPGIPLKEQELIFNKFVRGSSADSQQAPGAGLGLAACKAIAKLMGGGVGVDSQPGAGSTFFLQVTLASPAAARGAGSPVSPDAGRGGPSQSGNAAPGEGGPFAPTAPDAASGQTAGPLVVPSDGEGEARPALPSRALLVEDQPYNQLVARSILERLGYSVDVAATGAEARAQIEAGGFTLAVFDWDVPGAKGDELARFLRSQPNGESPIVLAATAHDTEDIRQQCFSSGMDGFLVKPLDEALIQETVHAAQLRRREAVGSGAADFKIFHYLGYGDDAKAQIAANEYAAQLEVELKGVSDALAREDDPGLAACAHRLRGHAAVVRFIPLKEAARRLQKAAKSGAAREALAEAAREVDRQAALLRELLKSFRAPASRG